MSRFETVSFRDDELNGSSKGIDTEASLGGPAIRTGLAHRLLLLSASSRRRPERGDGWTVCKGESMNRTHLWSVIWLSALTFSTLSYQQCAPANFSAAPDTTVTKAAAIGTGDGAVVDDTDGTVVDDSSDSLPAPAPDQACISRASLKIDHQDGIPMAACPKDSSESCVVICHVPPGNPAAAHTIMIGASALQAHLNHGKKAARSMAMAEVQCNRSDRASSDLPKSDYLGECGSGPANDPPMDSEICQEP